MHDSRWLHTADGRHNAIQYWHLHVVSWRNLCLRCRQLPAMFFLRTSNFSGSFFQSTKMYRNCCFTSVENFNVSHSFRFSQRRCVLHIPVFCQVPSITAIHVHILQSHANNRQARLNQCERWRHAIWMTAETQIVWISVHIMSTKFAIWTGALYVKLCVRYFHQDYNTANFDFVLVSSLFSLLFLALSMKIIKKIHHLCYRCRHRQWKTLIAKGEDGKVGLREGTSELICLKILLNTNKWRATVTYWRCHQ